MNQFPHDTSSPPGGSFPDNRAACQSLLVRMQTDAAAIKDQIAAQNLACQAGRTRMDPDWFHRARTALRHKRREIAELQAHMKSLPGSSRDRRYRLKDCIIETVRPDYGDDEWRSVLDQAHRLLDTHGAR
ncbi:hypothetical protein [Magnetofaba australis]|uniref:hypothetical protein n=1 Tax=Magnetofaba australis TaxID=1472297 RepID=UPI001F536130|nr:hypothetical protein [Magnetofaba australis]